MMMPLSTRNDAQRSKLAVFNNVANITITDILAALLFPMLVLPKIKGNIHAWITVMRVVAIAKAPRYCFYPGIRKIVSLLLT